MLRVSCFFGGPKAHGPLRAGSGLTYAAPPGLGVMVRFARFDRRSARRCLGAEARIDLGRLPGAEAPLFPGSAGLAVCLKAYPDTNRARSQAADRSIRSTRAVGMRARSLAPPEERLRSG